MEIENRDHRPRPTWKGNPSLKMQPCLSSLCSFFFSGAGAREEVGKGATPSDPLVEITGVQRTKTEV